MKTRNLFLAQIAILFLISRGAFPQETGNTFAGGGPLGIYVTLGSELPSSIRTVNGGVAYVIDRRISGEQNWQDIATVKAPTSLAEFRSRLERSMHEVTQPIPLDKIPVDKLWQRMRQYGFGDSLEFWSDVLQVRLAVGMTYLDTKAKREVHYQYRVSLVDQSNHPVRVLMSNVASYPGVANLAKLRLLEKEANPRIIELKWAGEPPSGFYTFVPYRQDGLGGRFKAISVPRVLVARGDSIFCSVQDTSITPFQAYRYYLLPTDFLGNPGVPSDTALVGAYTFIETPLPDSMNVISLDSTGGLRISWRLQGIRTLRNLAIYRSVDYNKRYKKLADIAPQSDSYVDQTARPMTRYFYYLVMKGLLGETSPPSAKVFGMYISSIPPLAPAIVGAVGTANGVRLSIVATDNRDAYFQVYRNDGFHNKLYLVSGVMPIRDSITVFEDTSRALSGNLTYAYAVRAEGASHVLSGFSDTVYVRPGVPTHPPTPLGLTATVEGKAVQLYWHDMQPFDNALRGYIVYRRTLNSGKSPEAFVKISPSYLPAGQNHLADTTAEVGVYYDYAVRSVDMFGAQSGLSASAQAGIPAVKPIAPAGLSATSTQSGILLQWDRTFQPNLMEYRLYRYQRGVYPIRIATVRPGQTLEALDDHTEKGQLYFYYLTSVNTKGVESGRGEEVGIRR